MDTHAKFDSFILELGAEAAVSTQGYIANKALRLKQHLIAHPDALTPDGDFMIDAVEFAAARSGSLPRPIPRGTFPRWSARR